MNAKVLPHRNRWKTLPARCRWQMAKVRPQSKEPPGKSGTFVTRTLQLFRWTCERGEIRPVAQIVRLLQLKRQTRRTIPLSITVGFPASAIAAFNSGRSITVSTPAR